MRGFANIAARAAAVLLAIGGPGAIVADSLPVPAADLQERAYDAARATVPAPDRFMPETFRLSGEAPPPGAELRLMETDGPNQSGVVRLIFGVVSDGSLPKRVFTTVRGSVYGPALVATRSMRRGEAIPATAVELSDVELTRLRHVPLRDAVQLREQTPVRTLSAGRILTEDLLEPIPLVRRNEAVTLAFVRPGFSVKATGTALADGAAGETITVVNEATGARVLCEVQADGALHVIRGLGPRRSR